MQGKARIGHIAATSIVVANMVGTGVFTSLGFQIVEIQSIAALLLLWLIGGLIALTGALTYGELASHLPRSGGEYHFLSQIYHPLPGFLSGWVSILVGFAAPTALAAMAMASYLNTVFSAWTIKPLASIIVILIALVHSFSINTGSVFQVLVTVLKVLLIVVFIGAGLLHDAPMPSISFAKTDWLQVISPGFAVSLVYVSYAFSGWNASVYIADEIRKPKRNIPYSLITGTAGVTLLYLLLNLVFLKASSLQSLRGKVEVGAIAAEDIFGPGGGSLISIMIALLLISTISAMTWIGPRVALVMGEDYPFLKILARKNRNDIPLHAIWFQTLITLILIISATFEEVLVYSGFILNLFTILTVAGIFVVRRKYGAPNSYKVWGYPFTPIFFILISFWTMGYLIYEKPQESFYGFLTLVAGVLVYLVQKNFKPK
jgi:APA family basic amino acid/polyamine antiporter